jgi:hypothetical protein
MSIPYSSATSGDRAREEVVKVLRRFGCEKIGFMDDHAKHEVTLAFEHRGRPVQLRASAKGWAQMWLKANPPLVSLPQVRAGASAGGAAPGPPGGVLDPARLDKGPGDGNRLRETDLLPAPEEKVVSLPTSGTAA